MENDNWLNRHYITCTNCNELLQICDHSPYDGGYRMYCNSCPKRVSISNYDPINEKIPKLDQLSYNELLLTYQRLLENCSCGGQFELEAKRRCLHCATPLELEEHQNVWLNEYWNDFTDEQEEERIEQQMARFIVEPIWKK